MTYLPFSRPGFTLLCVLLLCVVSAPAHAAQIATVTIPASCRPPWQWLGLCRADAALERRLEEEYWARMGASDLGGMNDWLSRMKDYLSASKTPRMPRLSTLVAAGYVMEYRGRELFDVTGLPLLLEALVWAEKAHQLAPNSPNAGSFYYFLRAYRQFGLLDYAGGMASVNTLLSFPALYGPKGSEGEVVGALALGLLTDPAQAEHTLDILDDCQTANCQRTSSLAPHKVLGMHMALAESYAKVGDLQGMYESLARARALASASAFPFPERIDSLEHDLTRPGGLIDQWNAGKLSIGYVRLPLPPSAGVSSCSTCHVGATIPATTW